MIKIYDRHKKVYFNEKVAGGKFIDILYNNSLGKLTLEIMLKRKIYTCITGILCDMKISSKNIKSFIKDFEIDTNTFLEDMESYKTFNDFFIRKLKPKARPFDVERSLLLSPGDGRLKVWDNIDIDNVVQVKGLTYSLQELLGDENLANKFRQGTCLLLRLCPVDYHRFHFIDDGIARESKYIRGQYYSVNPVALTTIPKVFCKNKRAVSVLNSQNFGDIAYVEVGATSVGSIVQLYEPNQEVKRGDEKGYFKFGGSTIVLFLQKGVANIDKDILEQTKMGFETLVLAGESIGKRVKK